MNVNRVVHTDSRILVWLAGLLLSPIDCRRYYSNYPELAEVIQGMDIKVEYISVMHQAQKMTGLTALEQLMAFVGSMVSVDPNVLDKIDRDEMVDRYAEMLGVPPSVIISDDKVAQTRQAKAQQQQMAEAAQMGMMAAQGAKTLADTPVGQNSALDALVPGLGGWQQR